MRVCWTIQVWNHLHEFCIQLSMLFTILSHSSYCYQFKAWCFDKCQISIQLLTCHRLLYFLNVKSQNHYQIDLWITIFVYSSELSWFQWNEFVLRFHSVNCCNCFDFLAWRWASELWMQHICERYWFYLVNKQMQKICLKSKLKIEMKHLSQSIFSDL